MIYFWIILGGIIVFKLSLFINHKWVERSLPAAIGATKRNFRTMNIYEYPAANGLLFHHSWFGKLVSLKDFTIIEMITCKNYAVLIDEKRRRICLVWAYFHIPNVYSFDDVLNMEVGVDVKSKHRQASFISPEIKGYRVISSRNWKEYVAKEVYLKMKVKTEKGEINSVFKFLKSEARHDSPLYYDAVKAANELEAKLRNYIDNTPKLQDGIENGVDEIEAKIESLRTIRLNTQLAEMKMLNRE
ncbi:MAG: hypothetical protein ACTTHI_07745 [Prevotella sp.]